MARRRTGNDQIPKRQPTPELAKGHIHSNRKHVAATLLSDKKSTDIHDNAKSNSDKNRYNEDSNTEAHELNRVKGSHKGDDNKEKEADKTCAILGFRLEDVTSWTCVVRLLNRPCDPASLGTLRFLFGFLMVLDTFQERGLATADSRWGDTGACRFPLFDFLRPLPLTWMVVVYVVMLMGATGIMLGFKFRLSCLMYLGPYWYMFFLDKTSWNNHSYLFGILAFLFAVSDANRYWSLDAFLDPTIQNKHVPLWNYTLIRTQIFLLYFIAGLKKLDIDWVSGYSMQNISTHWVFDPLKLVLTEPQIDLYIVHLGGLTLDLSMGFLLLLDVTRPLGLVMSTSFHLMNSQIFSIGLFPFACLATQLVFCNFNWPREIFGSIPPALRICTPEDGDLEPSGACLYEADVEESNSEHSNISLQKIDEKNISSNKDSTESSSHSKTVLQPTKATNRHKAAVLFTCVFISWQCCLPYSHGITKGYNTWTNGLYGYSWDMMVHSWYIQHVRVTYVDKDTGESGYLDPLVWGGNRRWSSHADMIKQFASCAAENLRSYDIENVEIYLDIWRSLNQRFQQRVVNPHVDMVTAEWNPFNESSWLLPLMTGLSDWRGRLEQIQSGLGTDENVEVVFVADFPGLYLENYVQPDFGNTSLSVLDGQVIVELIDDKRNITLGPGETTQIPSNTFHNVHTVSAVPSCYMYMFVNTTEVDYIKMYSKFEEHYNKTSLNKTLEKYKHDPYLEHYNSTLKNKQKKQSKFDFWEEFKSFLYMKYKMWRRSIRISYGAIYCLTTNSSFTDFLGSMYKAEAQLASSIV